MFFAVFHAARRRHAGCLLDGMKGVRDDGFEKRKRAERTPMEKMIFSPWTAALTIYGLFVTWAFVLS